jgi:pantoate--beta-alanine ligase
MQTIRSIFHLKKIITQLKQKNKTIGFIPTMGDLHEGHCSLMRNSRRENDITILSIFVNPTQFGPKEDFTKYPREEKKDKLLAKKEKVDIIFFPTEEMLYPKDYLTYIETLNISTILCGKNRNNHFKGVTTIVGKLLNLVEPNKIYLGQKDAQQAIIVKQMIKDLNFSVTTKVCPIIREKDGLALSSRNKYLSKKDRLEASILHKALKDTKKEVLAKNIKTSKKAKAKIKSLITKFSSGKIDYIECVNTKNLENITNLNGKILIALAVKFGKARLLDNITINKK